MALRYIISLHYFNLFVHTHLCVQGSHVGKRVLSPRAVIARSTSHLSDVKVHTKHSKQVSPPQAGAPAIII